MSAIPTNVEALPLRQDAALRSKLRPLLAFLERPEVLEVCVNRPGEVWVETLAGWEAHEVHEVTFDRLMELGTALATLRGQFVSERKPLLSADLPTRERVQVVQPSATEAGVVAVSIRKPAAVHFSLDDLGSRGFFGRVGERARGQEDVRAGLARLHAAGRFAEFLRAAVRARMTILLAGATSSGKTTLMKALAHEVPADERIITLEDAAELQGLPHRNRVSLFYSKGQQGASDVGPQELLEACMRLRPDRIFLAEVRGAEAFSFLDLAASGHPGSMTSIHAGSPDEAFHRLAMLVRRAPGGASMSSTEVEDAARRVIDVVVHCARVDGKPCATAVHFEARAPR